MRNNDPAKPGKPSRTRFASAVFRSWFALTVQEQKAVVLIVLLFLLGLAVKIWHETASAGRAPPAPQREGRAKPGNYPEYCAKTAQCSVFANDGRVLAKTRRLERVTQWVIRSRQVVNPL